ncbi:four-carbon acid sugar kinase family protein [Litchfieldella xinjiangensis]|uniref:four-carbon acid sugar kinase family protein n=1 Tax=Litchfieldella xinjiangensis TaxID=1166948 RepID=UPI0006937C42|nr:four-carbon acid sugar kinase family protein [Halomonas xinjiangensis]
MAALEKYIFIADDFTGATDTLATLARAGLVVRLFLHVPSLDEVVDLDAFGIATEARALGNDEIAELMTGIGQQLVPHQPEFIHYKTCSTFDSAPGTGNFALAMQHLSRAVGIRRQAIIGGQPSLGRYCAFGHLFARAADGPVYRIDRHPVMKDHPVTPMTESDLARHFMSLGGEPPTLVDYVALKQPGDEGQHSLSGVTLFDAIDQQNVSRVGDLLRTNSPILCAGPSSVAEAVAGTGEHRKSQSMLPNGPVLAFVGSRSSVSAEQVRQAQEFEVFPLTPTQITADDDLDDIIKAPIMALQAGKNVLLYIDASSSTGTPRELAQKSAALISTIVSNSRVGALIIAGGDTSSAISRALQPHCIAYLGDIDRGVSLCRAEFENKKDLPIVLKGGQVGRPQLFDHLALNIFRKKTC